VEPGRRVVRRSAGGSIKPGAAGTSLLKCVFGIYFKPPAERRTTGAGKGYFLQHHPIPNGIGLKVELQHCFAI